MKKEKAGQNPAFNQTDVACVNYTLDADLRFVDQPNPSSATATSDNIPGSGTRATNAPLKDPDPPFTGAVLENKLVVNETGVLSAKLETVPVPVPNPTLLENKFTFQSAGDSKNPPTPVEPATGVISKAAVRSVFLAVAFATADKLPGAMVKSASLTAALLPQTP